MGAYDTGGLAGSMADAIHAGIRFNRNRESQNRERSWQEHSQELRQEIDSLRSQLKEQEAIAAEKEAALADRDESVTALMDYVKRLEATVADLNEHLSRQSVATVGMQALYEMLVAELRSATDPSALGTFNVTDRQKYIDDAIEKFRQTKMLTFAPNPTDYPSDLEIFQKKPSPGRPG